MPRLIRRIAALTAAYAIALQAILSGFVSAAPAGFDSLAVLCTGGSTHDDAAPLLRHDLDCQACPLACGGGAPALTPSGATVSPVRLAADPSGMHRLAADDAASMPSIACRPRARRRPAPDPRRRRLPEHDPEKWVPVFGKIMLHQEPRAG